MAYSFAALFFDSTQLSIQQKQTVLNLDHYSRDLFSFDFLEKGLGIVYPTMFFGSFFKKNVSHVILY